MKNSKRLFLLLTLCALAFSLMLVLSSCTEKDPHADGHKFGGEYECSSTSHWQYCQIEGCEERSKGKHVSAGEATLESAEYCSVCNYEMSPKLHPLSDKKIIFIGNSHTYFGGVVTERIQSVHSMEKRQNCGGTFYNIARREGATNLNVTNWTYGGHSLSDIFSGNCQAERECFAKNDKTPGYDHAKDLTDKYYDYVVIQQGSSKVDDVMYWIEHIKGIFLEANPNVKFYFIVHARAHNNNYVWLTDVKRIESELGMTIIDWGDLVYDVYTGATAVPGAQLTHNKDSYVIAKDAKDGYHPSLLAGYVASLMTYCAITGESAVGKSVDCIDTSIGSFISQNYNIRETNFHEILKSPSDMTGLQQLIDKYLEEKNYRTYTAENH